MVYVELIVKSSWKVDPQKEEAGQRRVKGEKIYGDEREIKITENHQMKWWAVYVA